MNAIEQLRDDIAANRVPGGSAFARAGAELIALTLDADRDLADAQAAKIVADLADWLTDMKPSMAVVRNLADRARTVAAVVADTRVADAVVADMRAYIAQSELDIPRLAAHATEVISPGSTVLVHSYSASMLAALVATARQPGGFRLLMTESRPYRESRRLVAALHGLGTPITLFSDAGVAIAAAQADLALVGADSIFRDGSFANKTGTLPLALACARFDRPLYVASELAKLYRGAPDDITMELRPAEELAEQWEAVAVGHVRVHNQFFERVDAGLVTGYLTEYGVRTPAEIAAAAGRLG